MASDRSNLPFITLGDVLAQSYLGLHLAVGGVEATSLPVTGAHAIEIPNPSRWVSPKWLALTTGLRLKSKPEAQRELIVELKNSGITALGFGLDVCFRHIPPALFEEAERLDFPIFTVPFSTGFAEVIAYVNQSLTSPHLNTLLRFVSMQDYLLSALADDNPLSAVTLRMSQLLGLDIIITDTHGAVIESSSVLDAPIIDALAPSLKQQVQKEFPDLFPDLSTRGVNSAQGWTGSRAVDDPGTRRYRDTKRGGEAAEYISTVVDFVISGRSATAVSVGTIDTLSGWLIAVENSPLATEGLHLRLPLLRSVAHLVGATLHQSRSHIDEHRSRRRLLYRSILQEQSTSGDTSSFQRARGSDEGLMSFGFDPVEPCVALRITSSDGPPQVGLQLNHGRILSSLEESSIPFLFDIDVDGISLLLQCQPVHLATMVAEILVQPDLLVGVSEWRPTFAGASKAATEAAFCVALLVQEGKLDSAAPVRTRYTAELSIPDWLILNAPESALLERQKERLKPIAQQKSLLPTMRALFDANLDVSLAADRLGIHPNSLRYRMVKVEEELGISLHRISDLVEIYLALKEHP